MENKNEQVEQLQQEERGTKQSPGGEVMGPEGPGSLETTRENCCIVLDYL